MLKINTPHKICIVCSKPFTYRKKWRNCWDKVKYCSKRCRGKKNERDYNNSSKSAL